MPIRTRRLLLAATALTTSLLGVSCKKERPKYANDKRPMYSPDAGVDAAPDDAGDATPPVEPPAGEP